MNSTGKPATSVASTAGQGPGGGVSPPGLIGQIATALRRERVRSGLSLTELAKRAGIAKSTLSQLESGAGNPSVETLWALATALDVQFSRLVDPARQVTRVIRAGEGPVIYAERASYAATLLATCPPGARRDIYHIRVQPGEARFSDPHPPGSSEHVVLSAGRALAGLVGEPVELLPGDYVTYPGDVPHVFRALAANTAAVLVMEST